jgi:phosphoribosylformylglycinamidine synthase
MSRVVDFAAQGGLVLGICNGFQILLEAGLLPGAMLRNRTLRFICKPVHLKVKNTETPFTRTLQEHQVLRVPIAHGEGNYYCDDKTLKELENNRQIVFTYCTPEGIENDAANPNGSLANIAGITNKAGNVLGMMPHPERCSESVMGGVDGYPIFAAMISWLQEVGR